MRRHTDMPLTQRQNTARMSKKHFKPQDVADWLYACEVRELTPQDRADLYNSTAAFLARCRSLLRGESSAKTDTQG